MLIQKESKMEYGFWRQVQEASDSRISLEASAEEIATRYFLKPKVV